MEEILIYGGIRDYTASAFINQVNELEGKELNVRLSTDGGSPEATWGIIAKTKEHKGVKNLKVDGKAYSMGGFYCCYFDEVTALDVSQFMLHRAAYPSYVERNPEMFTDDVKSHLKNINDNLRAAFEAKVDVAKFEKITKVTVDDVFSIDSRVDVYLTAKQAKQIGLINKYVTITPSAQKEIESAYKNIASGGEDQMFKVAASAEYEEVKKVFAKEDKPKPVQQKKQKQERKMDIQELRANHPELYDQIYNDGVTAERTRVTAWNEWSDVAPKEVSEAIEKGSAITMATLSKFARLGIQATALKDLEEDSADDVEPKGEQVQKTTAGKKDAEVKAFNEELKKELKNIAVS